VINTPHNPTGKVFTRDELTAIAGLCIEHDVLVLSDEVYEQLVFGVPHISMADIPGMRERTLALSSAGKTFSFTGWKIGWASGPRALVAAAQAAHQFVTFSSATPLQLGIAVALERCDTQFYDTLRAEYLERRDFLVSTLRDVGLDVAVPEGTYFALADFSAVWDGDDISFAKHLCSAHRVAAIPPSVFYAAEPEQGARLVRFAFCKQMKTLQAAAERLRGLGT
jgi:N-succinyldiaminopimelate aminotransferase